MLSIRFVDVIANQMFSLLFAAKCSCYDNGRRAGVCHPAKHHRQAVVRPSRQDDWPTRGLVLRAAIYRSQRWPHMDQTLQKGESSSSSSTSSTRSSSSSFVAVFSAHTSRWRQRRCCSLRLWSLIVCLLMLMLLLCWLRRWDWFLLRCSFSMIVSPSFLHPAVHNKNNCRRAKKKRPLIVYSDFPRKFMTLVSRQICDVDF